jgi:hypothetical protein
MAKRKRKKPSVTQRMRANTLKALTRREAKGLQVTDATKSFIKQATLSQLRALHKNRYAKLDELLSEQSQITTDTLSSRYQYLLSKGLINPESPEDELYYKSMIQYATSNTLEDIQKASKSLTGRKASFAKEALILSQRSPEAFNTFFGTADNEKPNSKNTADTQTLVYDSVMSRIEEAFAYGNSSEQFLANELDKMVQEQIQAYGFDKTVQGMEQADGWLLSTVEYYFFSSDQWVNDGWKNTLMSMAHVIQGYMDDETQERMSELSELLEEHEEV